MSDINNIHPPKEQKSIKALSLSLYLFCFTGPSSPIAHFAFDGGIALLKSLKIVRQMAGEGRLSFSVASVVEDVLQQHGNRPRDLDLESRKAEEAGTSFLFYFFVFHFLSR